MDARTKAAINNLYEARENRDAHPDGEFDKAGRWFPAEGEACDCCKAIRSPSRSYPYSYMQHCRTKKHIASLIAKNPALVEKWA